MDGGLCSGLICVKIIMCLKWAIRLSTAPGERDKSPKSIFISEIFAGRSAVSDAEWPSRDGLPPPLRHSAAAEKRGRNLVGGPSGYKNPHGYRMQVAVRPMAGVYASLQQTSYLSRMQSCRVGRWKTYTQTDLA